MKNTVPPVLFRSLAWAGSAAFLAVAMIEWRLGSIYHTVLALGLSGLTFFTAGGKRQTWPAVLLLAFGIYRALTGNALLRGT